MHTSVFRQGFMIVQPVPLGLDGCLLRSTRRTIARSAKRSYRCRPQLRLSLITRETCPMVNPLPAMYGAQSETMRSLTATLGQWR